LRCFDRALLFLNRVNRFRSDAHLFVGHHLSGRFHWWKLRLLVIQISSSSTVENTLRVFAPVPQRVSEDGGFDPKRRVSLHPPQQRNRRLQCCWLLPLDHFFFSELKETQQKMASTTLPPQTVSRLMAEIRDLVRNPPGLSSIFCSVLISQPQMELSMWRTKMVTQ
jgi:hypothetical protein